MMRILKGGNLPSGLGVVLGFFLSIPLWIVLLAAGYWIHRLMS
jgi:type III secretory pathway component EscT